MNKKYKINEYLAVGLDNKPQNDFLCLFVGNVNLR